MELTHQRQTIGLVGFKTNRRHEIAGQTARTLRRLNDRAVNIRIVTAGAVALIHAARYLAVRFGTLEAARGATVGQTARTEVITGTNHVVAVDTDAGRQSTLGDTFVEREHLATVRQTARKRHVRAARRLTVGVVALVLTILGQTLRFGRLDANKRADVRRDAACTARRLIVAIDVCIATRCAITLILAKALVADRR